MKFGVIVFPGSNCDHDCFWVMKEVFGLDTEFIWHKEREITGVDCLILPGGFSYGDYLRTGAIARFSPVMESVIAHAVSGGLVIGICNGFQVLTECGLLPGALMRNRDLHFICREVTLRVESDQTPFTSRLNRGQVLRIPIAHGEGNYYAGPETLRLLNEQGRIAFRYCDGAGEITDRANPNGSLENIAGITNEAGNVLGMMPHPERCSDEVLGGTDGRAIFESILAFLEKKRN